MPSTKASSGFLGFFKAHPIICLLLLSPGIPEYLSSSSPLNAIVLNPLQFLLQLALNLGLYGSGVILIREAAIRWKKGWATILLLGAAYGILEEGVALSTLYNPMAHPVGKLGFYGHYLGVNWIWVAGILPVHMIFSISLPILLLGLALPNTNGKSLVISKSKIAMLFAILGLDVCSLFLLVLFGQHFWMGWPIFISSFVAIGLLVFFANRASPSLLYARAGDPKISPLRIAIVGVLFYTLVLFAEQLGIGRVPASVDLIAVILVQLSFLLYVQKVIGSENNARQLIAIAAGLVVPIALFGFIAELSLPLVLIADLAFGIFIWGLLRNYKTSSTRKRIQG